MPDQPQQSPTGICLAVTRAECRLVIRRSYSQRIAWPMLVADPCPFSLEHDPWTIPNTHAHVHYMTEPGPWIRVAPCNRQPYLITLAVA